MFGAYFTTDLDKLSRHSASQEIPRPLWNVTDNYNFTTDRHWTLS